MLILIENYKGNKKINVHEKNTVIQLRIVNVIEDEIDQKKLYDYYNNHKIDIEIDWIADRINVPK